MCLIWIHISSGPKTLLHWKIKIVFRSLFFIISMVSDCQDELCVGYSTNMIFNFSRVLKTDTLWRNVLKKFDYRDSRENYNLHCSWIIYRKHDLIFECL